MAFYWTTILHTPLHSSSTFIVGTVSGFRPKLGLEKRNMLNLILVDTEIMKFFNNYPN